MLPGEVDDENDIDPDKDWSAHWRMLFKKISVKDIEEFEKKYKGNFTRGGGYRNFFWGGGG